MEVGCSLGAGGGDELSDIDAGVGYHGIRTTDLYVAARAFAVQIRVPVDLVVHRMDGWPDDVCRVAAEYADGLQLDLVLMPADGRPGLPDRSIAVVDKDQRLAVEITPPLRLPPSIDVAHEWVVLGWWAIATADKYVRRSSLFEAVQAIDEARTHALRLWAAGRGVPYAAFGLTSLLDFPPFELPPDLDRDLRRTRRRGHGCRRQPGHRRPARCCFCLSKCSARRRRLVAARFSCPRPPRLILLRMHPAATTLDRPCPEPTGRRSDRYGRNWSARGASRIGAVATRVAGRIHSQM